MTGRHWVEVAIGVVAVGWFLIICVIGAIGAWAEREGWPRPSAPWKRDPK